MKTQPRQHISNKYNTCTVVTSPVYIGCILGPAVTDLQPRSKSYRPYVICKQFFPFLIIDFVHSFNHCNVIMAIKKVKMNDETVSKRFHKYSDGPIIFHEIYFHWLQMEFCRVSTSYGYAPEK